MRIRICFSKTEAMRYTGHLDLHRTWERTFRRADLPLAYSQGYNPRPKINLASALPLGFTSSGEVLDAWLENDIDIPTIEIALWSAVPPGVSITSIVEADPKFPSLQSDLLASEYLVRDLDPAVDFGSKIDTLLALKTISRQLRHKTYDLRPLIEFLEFVESGPSIRMLLSAREGATGRPDEVLQALGIDPLSTRIHRTALIFRSCDSR